MPVTPVSFQPVDGRVFKSPTHFRRGTMTDDVTLTLTRVLPAPFLPVITKDPGRLEAAFVMYPGTIVGVLNERDHAAIIAKFGEYSPNLLVPAFAGATYKLGYTAFDAGSDDLGGVLDLDGNGSQFRASAAAGLTTATIATVKPLGVVQEFMLNRAMSLKFRNYARQLQPNILSGGQVIRIAVMTAEEDLIRKGDRVMVSNGAGHYDLITNPTTSFPGRWKKWDGTTLAHLEHIVGTCIENGVIIKQTTPSAGVALGADLITNGGPSGTWLNKATLNLENDWHIAARINATPGLGLQGSWSLGIPSNLHFARANASGEYRYFDIALAVNAIA